VAILSATLLEDRASEGIATLGLEAGAALWVGGAVAWTVRATTVGRALLVVAAAAAGVILIALALALDWSGAALDLSMEFGVGALHRCDRPHRPRHLPPRTRRARQAGAEHLRRRQRRVAMATAQHLCR
jgi:hypothetical protein